MKIVGVLAIISSLFFMGISGYSYYSSYSFEKRGDQLLEQNKYSEALTTFQKVGQRWSSDKLLEKIRKSNILNVSEENYQLGKDALDDKSYEQAIKYFSLIDKSFPQYKSATQFVAEAQEEIQTLEMQEIQPQVLGIEKEQVYNTDTTEESTTGNLIIENNSIIFPTRAPTSTIKPYNYSIVDTYTDKYKINEAERKADEAESCQRSTEIYSNCMEDFNRSMDNYADCNQRLNDEMQDYSDCISKYNRELEDYQRCVENPYDLSFNYCSKPTNWCFKPHSTSCLKPMNWCTKPYCN